MPNFIDQFFETPVFETERLVAGHWHSDLAPAAFEMYSDPDVLEHMPMLAQDSVESMREKIVEIIARNAKWPKHWGSWPVFAKDTRELAGTMMMKPLPDADGNFTPEIEIGWHLARPNWGQGLATECGRKLIELGFSEEINLDALHAVTGLENTRSQAVARRLGLEHVGKTDAYYGQTVDLFKIINKR